MNMQQFVNSLSIKEREELLVILSGTRERTPTKAERVQRALKEASIRVGLFYSSYANLNETIWSRVFAWTQLVGIMLVMLVVPGFWGAYLARTNLSQFVALPLVAMGALVCPILLLIYKHRLTTVIQKAFKL